MSMFIYDLPYSVRSDLSASLDAGEAWRELAGRRLGYDHLQMERFNGARHRAGTSPADALVITHSRMFVFLFALTGSSQGSQLFT